MAWETLIQTVRTSSGNIYLIKYATSVFPRVGNPDEHNWWWLANQTKERAQWENVLSLVETSASLVTVGSQAQLKLKSLHWAPVCTTYWLWMLTTLLFKNAKQFYVYFCINCLFICLFVFLNLYYWQTVERPERREMHAIRVVSSDIWSQRWVVCYQHCVGKS